MDGYITWPRSMEDEFAWYRDPQTAWLFLHLVTKATIADSHFAGEQIARGSVVTSVARLVSETGMTTGQVRTAIDHLVQTGDVVKQSRNRYTVFAIPGFDSFCGKAATSNDADLDSKRTTNGQQTDSKRIANGQQHYKKEKKIKSTSLNTADIGAIVEAWNGIGVNPVKGIAAGTKRMQMLEEVFGTFGLAGILAAVENVSRSDFLKGKDWFTLDWLLKPDMMQKALEGYYNRAVGKPEATEAPVPEVPEEPQEQHDDAWWDEYYRTHKFAQ